MGDFQPSIIADVELARSFSNLTPRQICMCRGHLEFLIIQFCGWNSKELEPSRLEKVSELNDRHGRGFGDALWAECEESILSLFDPATLEASKNAWVKPDVDPSQ